MWIKASSSADSLLERNGLQQQNLGANLEDTHLMEMNQLMNSCLSLKIQLQHNFIVKTSLVINHSQTPNSNPGKFHPSVGLPPLPFLLYRPTPKAYRSTQSRGWMELQLLANATATVTLDASFVCDLHHSLQQMLDP